MSRKNSNASAVVEPSIAAISEVEGTASKVLPSTEVEAASSATTSSAKSGASSPEATPPAKAKASTPEATPPTKAKASEPEATPPAKIEASEPKGLPPPYEETPAPKDAKDEKKPLDVEQADKDVKPEKIPYPKSVFFIVVNEFCERFNYYGMRTVLSLYMRDILGFDEDKATVLYHTFIMLCYFTPIIGAIIADTYLGKFKTIVSLSIFYACGSILLSISAMPLFAKNPVPASMTGLFIIALGTGGIKPCVSAFGGDQFVRPQQDRQLEAFFSVFYFAINAGSLISTFVTPILREDVHCFGQESCYPLAFGVPAILMIVAVIIFILGKPLYKINKPGGTVMVDFGKCIGRAIKRKILSKGEKHEHWLYYASDKYPKKFIEEVRRVLSVAFIYIPLPVFWTLYDQQGSRWTFQATRMNGDLGGGVVLKPDQMQIINPLLILILVPIFESFIYPAFKKCGLLTPLQRIACGLVLCGLSFVVSGFLEIALQDTYAKIPALGDTQLVFTNTLPCNVSVTYSVEDQNGTLLIPAPFYDTLYKPAKIDVAANQTIYVKASLPGGSNCADYIQFDSYETEVVLGEGNETLGYSVLITERDKKLQIARVTVEDQLEKTDSGDPYVGFLLDDKSYEENSKVNITITRDNRKKNKPGYYFEYLFNANQSNPLPTTETVPMVDNIIQTEYQDAEIGTFDVYLNDVMIGQLKDLIQGGVYKAIIQKELNSTADKYYLTTVEITTPNSVSILWLLPQYFVVTVGEVMFSVTGLTFSFTQAPESMKSVMQGIWALVVAFGNLLVIIIAEAESDMSQAEEFFLFAGIMGIATILFILMSWNYKYVEDQKKEEDEEKKRLSSSSSHKRNSSSSSSSDDDTAKVAGRDNQGFSE